MLSFRLLGPFEARDPYGGLVLPTRRKQRELLGLLVLRAGTPVGVDEMADALWGDRPPASARANLSSYVSGLRTVLKTVTPDGEARLRRVAGGHQLDLPADRCDVSVFERLVTDGRRAAEEGRPDRAAELLGTGLGLWRGPALQGLGEHDWLLPLRASLEEARLTAVEEEVGARLRLGRHQELVAELSALTAAHPLRERLTGFHMLALAGSGRRAEALRVYNAAADVLQAELGVEPGPGLRRVHRQLRTGDGAGDGHGSPGGPRLQPVPALLPPSTADFTGRAAEARRIEERLLAPAAVAPAVVGLAGMPGVGKSALALHLAHRVSGHYPDGQLYADLGGAREEPADPSDVLARFLRALGVDGRAVPPDPTDRSALYRSRLAGRKVLVVLDDAGSAQQVLPLLPGSGTCSVVITSRRRLAAVAGARWELLEELPTADAVRMLARVVDDDRVERRPEDAGRLAGLCGGLPLALRIAGARLAGRPDWTLARMVGLLEDEQRRLDRLTAGDLQVRASFALSERGLDDTARRLLHGLSLFDVPDFPELLAAAVLDDPVDGADALESLVDARLLSVARIDVAGQTRYRFHDLVRLHVREQAGPADAGVLDRGFGMWLGLAERMAVGVPGPCYAPLLGTAPRTAVPVPAVEPLRWFDAERHAVTAAAYQAARSGRSEVAYGLAAGLEKYFDVRGMYREWVALGSAVLDCCRRTGNRMGEAVLLRGLLDVRTWVDAAEIDPAGGPAALLERFAAVDCRAGMSDAAVMCSWERTAAGRWPEALELALRALRYADEAGHLGGRARAHAAAAVALRDQRRPAEATAHLTAALEAARSLGNPRYEATMLQYLGIVRGESGDLAGAERALLDSLAITRRYADDFSEALTLLGLARVHAAGGDAVRAQVEGEAALALGREYRMPHHTAEALTLLGELALAGERTADAVTLTEEAVAIWRERGWLSYLAAALTGLGRARRAVDPGTARGPWLEARELFHQLGDGDHEQAVELLLQEV